MSTETKPETEPEIFFLMMIIIIIIIIRRRNEKWSERVGNSIKANRRKYIPISTVFREKRNWRCSVSIATVIKEENSNVTQQYWCWKKQQQFAVQIFLWNNRQDTWLLDDLLLLFVCLCVCVGVCVCVCVQVQLTYRAGKTTR